MITQAMIAPPLLSPWVSIMPMREPSGVVYQATSLRLVLSVDLSTASGGMVPRSPSSRAVLSSSRQAAMLIWSMVPPVWYAVAQTAWRAASHALSSELMAASWAAEEVW